MKTVREVEMKQRMDQKATQPRANSLADSEKKVCDGSGQNEDAFSGSVVAVVSMVSDTPPTSGSSTATQLLPVSSLSGYL